MRATYLETRKRTSRERPNTRDERPDRFRRVAAEGGEFECSRAASGSDLENQRQMLLALRARLRGNVSQTTDAALGGYALESTSASPDAADRASETVEQDLALSLLGSAEKTLDQIDAALRRIEDGSYGRCEECETPIPAARLEAIPYAVCCVECAARQERAA